MKINKLNLLVIIMALSSCNLNNLVSEAIESVNNNVESNESTTSSNESSSKDSSNESTSSSNESTTKESSSTIESKSEESSSSIDEHECVYSDANEYIKFQKCSICGEYGKNKPTNEFLNVFTYTYDSSYSTIEENLYNEIDDLIESASTSTNLRALNVNVYNKLNDLIELANYLETQYHYSRVMSYKYNTETWDDASEEIYNLYSKSINEYNVLLNHIFNSNLKEIFYEGEDLEEVEKELQKYTDTTISELESQINELENKAYFEDVEKTTLFREDVAQLISLRNQLAKIYGYDNYYDYAYDDIYGRAYDSEMVSQYRSYVKKYFPSKYIEVAQNFMNNYNNTVNAINTYYYNVCFDDPSAMNRLANFYKTMTSEKYNINMYDTINNAFKEGRVFVGEEDGKEAAFTTDYSNSGNYMFFANQYYYGGSNCLVHESGHYMCDFSSIPISDFDLFETHSQSNEMFYLNYLSSIISKSKHSYLENYMAYDVINMALTSAIIDEIEECLYKNYCALDKDLMDGITTNEYDLLVETITSSYSEYVDVDNWKYYFTQSSCYVISYGLSLLPCYGLYFEMKNDVDAAREKYFKTLRFYEDKNFDTTDATYLDVLEYAGYYSPFDEKLYKLISNKA